MGFSAFFLHFFVRVFFKLLECIVTYFIMLSVWKVLVYYLNFFCQTCLVSPKIIITLVLVSVKYSHYLINMMVILLAFFFLNTILDIFYRNIFKSLMFFLLLLSLSGSSSKSTWSGLSTQSFSFNLLNAGYFCVSLIFLCSGTQLN